MSCQDCELCNGCETVKMEGHGPTKADVMIVGDFPSPTDDERGELFVGDNGSKLDYLLRKAKLKRSHVFLSSAIKCKPAWGKEPKKGHIDACRKHVMQEILDVRPKVIVAMGKVALESLINEKGISDFRGYFDEIEIEYPVKVGKKETIKAFKCQVIPTYSPQSCLIKWEYDDVVIHDLKKAKLYAETGKLPEKPALQVELITDLPALERATERLCNAKKFSFDTETTGFSFFKNEIINVGFCMEPGKAIVIPMRQYTNEESKKFDAPNLKAMEKINAFVRKYAKKIKDALRRIFASAARKIAHNGKFDVKFCRKNGFPVKNWTFDTIVAHSLVDENKPHDLSFCADWYGIHYGPYDHQLWQYVNKDKKKKKPYSFVPPLILTEYLGMDVDITFKLEAPLRRQLADEGVMTLFKEQQMPLARLMADLEYRGVKLDVPRLQSISKDFAGILADIDKKLKKITGNPTFNPNSPKQLCAYLEDVGALGNPGDKKTKSGGFSTDESVLSRLATKKKIGTVPRLILESRTIGKLKSNYLDGKAGDAGMLSWIDKNHHVHYNANIHTPRTGRMSVDDPALQTIPRPNPKYPQANIRQLFIPSKPDWCIFSVDFKQLEMRVAAFLSEDPVMIKEICDGVDMHSRNVVQLASKVGMISRDVTEEQFIAAIKFKAPEGWEKLPEKQRAKVEEALQLQAEWAELRNVVKALGFGLNYGMEASTLAKDHGRDEQDMQDMIDAYFDKYGGLAIWRDEQKDTALNEGVLLLPETGRKRRFHGAAGWLNSEYAADIRMREMDIESVYRQAMNFPIQGYANEIFVKGKLKLNKALRAEKLESRLMLSLHDGILGEGPMSEMHRVKELAKQCLERVLTRGKIKVPLGIDFELYDRWAGKKLELKEPAPKKGKKAA